MKYFRLNDLKLVPRWLFQVENGIIKQCYYYDSFGSPVKIYRPDIGKSIEHIFGRKMLVEITEEEFFIQSI